MSVVFFKQKTAYEMRISDWSSDVCSSDLILQYGLDDPDPSRTAFVRARDRVDGSDRAPLRQARIACPPAGGGADLHPHRFDFAGALPVSQAARSSQARAGQSRLGGVRPGGSNLSHTFYPADLGAPLV